MKIPFIIKELFIIFILFPLLLINVADLRCEIKSSSVQAQFRTDFTERRLAAKYDPEQQDEKSQKYEKRESRIKQILKKQCQRLDMQNLEDSLD